MDKHLAVCFLYPFCLLITSHPDRQKMAPKYFHTRFIRVFVENIPWLVERLSVKVLPCVICFIGGVSRDRHGFYLSPRFLSCLTTERLIGFEDLGNNDDFDTAVLELRLLNTGSFPSLHCSGLF
jgi:hypothetical protein